MSLLLHDILKEFRSGRGTGTARMELKLAQDLANIDQEPLLLVFLDLRKEYDTVDRECLLITLEGYSAAPFLCGLLETFWDRQNVVPRHSGLYGPAFPVTRVTTQGRLVSPTLLNMSVDNLIRTWLAMTLEDQRVAHEGLGETVGQFQGVFYADDGMVGSRDS